MVEFHIEEEYGTISGGRTVEHLSDGRNSLQNPRQKEDFFGQNNLKLHASNSVTSKKYFRICSAKHRIKTVVIVLISPPPPPSGRGNWAWPRWLARATGRNGKFEPPKGELAGLGREKVMGAGGPTSLRGPTSKLCKFANQCVKPKLFRGQPLF